MHKGPAKSLQELSPITTGVEIVSRALACAGLLADDVRRGVISVETDGSC